MPYNNAIPQPTDKRSKSQPQILANFKSIQDLFEINHGEFDATNQGKHIFLTLPIQAADPIIVATEGALYSKTSAYTALPALFFRRGLATPIEMTSRNKTNAGGEYKGWSYLPSGILMKYWGGLPVVGPCATYDVDFSLVGGPAFTKIFSTMVTIQTDFAENKTIYVKDYTLATQTVTLHTTLRYSGDTAIDNFYINILVMGI
jgi:hypothetical protein